MVDYNNSKIVEEGYKVASTEGGQGIKKDSLFSNYQLKEYQFSISKCKKFRRALDIGGCYGIQSIRMAKDFATVEVFEPLFYKFLEYNTKEFDNVNIHPYALSSESGTATMRVGLFNSGGSNIAGRKKHHRQTYEEVKTRTLDSYKFTDVDFIKIDVEGHEIEVINGAKETITNNKPVLLVEIEERHTQLPVIESINYIKKLGYNCFYINDKKLVPIDRLENTKLENNYYFIPKN